MEPVTIEVRQDHPFKRKPPHEDGRKRLGCEHCNGAVLAPQHFEVPSLNDGGSGMDRFAYQALKGAIEGVLTDALKASPLEPCDAITVEALIGFPTRRERDEGNHRWMIEKALGDVLVKGGWLPDDSFWPTRRYSMGNLEGVYTPHEHWLRLTLFPTAVTVAAAGAAGGQGRLAV
jgi:hypothetical protein